MVTSKCGTHAGWNQHMKKKEYPCSDCMAAKAEYAREWRKKSPAKYARQGDINSARAAAARRLALDYPAEFERHLREVKAERGLL